MTKDNGGRRGRPSANDNSGQMKNICFRVDAEAEAALKALEGQLDKSIRGRKSAVLRKLIVEAYAKIERGE